METYHWIDIGNATVPSPELLVFAHNVPPSDRAFKIKIHWLMNQNENSIYWKALNFEIIADEFSVIDQYNEALDDQEEPNQKIHAAHMINKIIEQYADTMAKTSLNEHGYEQYSITIPCDTGFIIWTPTDLVNLSKVFLISEKSVDKASITHFYINLIEKSNEKKQTN